MNSETGLPPIFRRLYAFFLPSGQSADVCDALNEDFERLARARGRAAARRWLWGQFFCSLPSLLKNAVSWTAQMVAADLKVSRRDMMRHKGYFLIAVAGLAVGAVCCLLISLYVRSELSFDDYHKDGGRIFRLLVTARFSEGRETIASTSELAAPTLLSDFPEVESAARMQRWMNPVFKLGTRVFNEDLVIYADQSLFDILTIPFLLGMPRGSLDRPGTVVLTESLAKKYFGADNPLGANLFVNGALTTVTGVVRDCPARSHLRFRAILSYKTFESRLTSPSWQRFDPHTYLKLRPGTDRKAFAGKVRRLSEPYLRIEDPTDEGQDYTIQPVRDIHLNTRLPYDSALRGDPASLWLFSGLALVILILACLNFINLTTARSAGRAKEVGVRKTVGARSARLVRQFLGESLLVAGAAFAAGGLAAAALLDRFSRFVGSDFSPADLLRPEILAVAAGLFLFTGFAAGVYPAFFLSSFRPASVLRRDPSIRLKGGGLRRVFVIGQFAAAVTLVAVTLSMDRQIRFMKTTPLGFAKEHKLVVVFPGGGGSIPSSIPGSRQAAVKQELARHPGVRSATLSSTVPGGGFFYNGTRRPEDPPERSRAVRYLFADADFLEDYRMELAAGRPILQTGGEGEILLNETALRAFGWARAEEAFGRRLNTGVAGVCTIVGVVRDFHQAGLQNAIEPLVLGRGADRYHMLTLTLGTDRGGEVLDFVRRAWSRLLPDTPLEYFFLDEKLARQYVKEERTTTLFSVFAGLGIFVACLGLFGMASFLAAKRTKEIGIRRILGASASGILGLLSREFVTAVLAAHVLAWPVAYFGGVRWLRHFAYRPAPSAAPFLEASLLALAVTLLSVGWRSWRAAKADPVTALRYE
ncbi:MAG: ABC transporter permease [Acidobacteriota bacterium]